MMKNPEQLFQLIHKDEWPACFTLYGQDAYLHRELRNAIKKAGFDFHSKDMKKKGPESQDEDLSYSTSLFQSKNFVWLETQAAPERWSEDSKKIWMRMLERADAQSFVLCLQIVNFSLDKQKASKSSSSKKKMNCGDEFLFEVPDSQKGPWLKRMNKVRGDFLDAQRCQHLMHMESDLMTLDQHVELWSLGGDAWAKIALSFDALDTSSAQHDEKVVNVAFAWVDALLEGRKDRALKMLSRLLSDGQEALPLVGLISRSLRIWALLDRGAEPKGEAPFLVEKVRRSRNAFMRTSSGQNNLRGVDLLAVVAEMDVWLKSRPVDAAGLLVRLSSR